MGDHIDVVRLIVPLINFNDLYDLEHAMMTASYHGLFKCIPYLLLSYPKISQNCRARLLFSALDYAGHLDTVQLSEKKQRTIFEKAVAFRHFSIVKYLLTQIELPIVQLRIFNWKGNISVLEFGAAHGNLDMVEFLLSNPQWKWGNLRSKAQDAAKKAGHHDIVAAIQKDIDTNPPISQWLYNSVTHMFNSFLQRTGYYGHAPAINPDDAMDIDEIPSMVTTPTPRT